MNETIDNTLATNTPPALACPSEPVPQTPAPAPHCTRQRWGTVAALSSRLRNWINHAIRDGFTSAQILEGLNKRRCDNINRKHIARWKRTGYFDWLAEQKQTEALRLRVEAISSSGRKTSGSSQKSVREIAEMNIAVKLLDVIKTTSVDELRALLATKPENFFRLIRAHAVHERNAIMRDRAALELKKYADVSKKQKRPKTPKRGGVTPEELERLTRRMNL